MNLQSLMVGLLRRLACGSVRVERFVAFCRVRMWVVPFGTEVRRAAEPLYSTNR